MKNFIYLIFILITLFFITISCESNEKIEDFLNSSEKQIIEFTFNDGTPSIINQESKTIIANFPNNTDIKTLSAKAILSKEAKVIPNPEEKQNYSNPITYTVIAADESKSEYTVTVMVETVINNSEERDLLIKLFNTNPNNTLEWDINNLDISTWQGVTLKDGYINSLNVSGKGLENMPPEIEKLSRIEKLYLNNNSFKNMPKSIGKLSNLTGLYLNQNNLIELPKEISNLNKLKDLFIEQNSSLSIIPIEVCNLNKGILNLKKDDTTSCEIPTSNVGAPYGKAGEQTAVRIDEATDNPSHGFYEYLPKSYDPNSNKKYPVVLFLHGLGEKGNGESELPKLLRTGVPKLLKNGKHFEAIIISPQSKGGWFTEQAFLKLYNYITSHYPVDTKRFYVTGLSAGGGGTWIALDYHSDKIAAVVPICGAKNVRNPSPSLQNKPIWVHHNFADGTVGVG